MRSRHRVLLGSVGLLAASCASGGADPADGEVIEGSADSGVTDTRPVVNDVAEPEAAAAPDGAPTEGDTAPTLAPYFPHAIGSRWTYRVTDPTSGEVTIKILTIDKQEAVGGQGQSAGALAFRHTTCKNAHAVADCANIAASDRTVGWTGSVNGVLVNYREQSYRRGTGTVTQDTWWDKFRTRIDETSAHTLLGARWMEIYTEWKRDVEGKNAGEVTSAKQILTWQVAAVDEMVKVPAMPDPLPCLKVTHSLPGGAPSGKFFWYSRGVGKVKETGGQIEELIEFALAP